MASGHVNRTNRPNTWAHRPICIGEKSPCQLGAVHTWGYNGLDADMPPWPSLTHLCHSTSNLAALHSSVLVQRCGNVRLPA